MEAETPRLSRTSQKTTARFSFEVFFPTSETLWNRTEAERVNILSIKPSNASADDNITTEESEAEIESGHVGTINVRQTVQPFQVYSNDPICTITVLNRQPSDNCRIIVPETLNYRISREIVVHQSEVE